ncbi:PA0069 family radical SAM protein [Shimia aestuarii]|uniref:DNA repair photolyase n=1 Tax=Shimia aestuarii TaxID=254406 RepID=A0A1I4NKA6_9RHOB|nr:PA0069 family radical SAM protein [Shimia aestuarii]SFM15891.1 DNA repair photolyase [Shimia aestuarii]
MKWVDIAPEKRRGRAAQSNRSGRSDLSREVIDDGWGLPEAFEDFRTSVEIEEPRSVITRNTSPDVPFDRSLNPYRGCEHGCIYCFARPTHAYLGYSAGLDFETRLVARPNAPEILATALRRNSYKVAPLAIGTNTDPYQPIEGTYEVMRGVLEVLQAFRHPVAIVTKGALIERDIDILAEMASEGLAQIGISVTTLDRKVARLMEPRVPAPERRLQSIERLSAAGIPVRVMMAPVVPAITDVEIEAVMRAGSEAGARAASWIMLRLPLEVSELFQEWLSAHFPERAARVMARVREMHRGQDYDARWGRRMRGEGVYAEMIARRFEMAMRRYGLVRKLPALRCDRFAPPLARGGQMDLFQGALPPSQRG